MMQFSNYFATFAILINYTIFTSATSDSSRTTINGIPCEGKLGCTGVSNEKRWCFTKIDRTERDYCCNSKCSAKRPYNDLCPFSCSVEGSFDLFNGCEPGFEPCRPFPLTRSVNNYECDTPCHPQGKSFDWCWLKDMNGAWDYCCYVGSPCGSVNTGEAGNVPRCYVDSMRRQAEICINARYPTAAPDDYQSPNMNNLYYLFFLLLIIPFIAIIVVACKC